MRKILPFILLILSFSVSGQTNRNSTEDFIRLLDLDIEKSKGKSFTHKTITRIFDSDTLAIKKIAVKVYKREAKTLNSYTLNSIESTEGKLKVESLNLDGEIFTKTNNGSWKLEKPKDTLIAYIDANPSKEIKMLRENKVGNNKEKVFELTLRFIEGKETYWFGNDGLLHKKITRIKSSKDSQFEVKVETFDYETPVVIPNPGLKKAMK